MCEIISNQEESDFSRNPRARCASAATPTSVQLENRFWRVLEAIAVREKLTLPQLLNKLNEEYIELRKRLPSNFASMLRVGCLRFVKHYPDILQTPNLAS